MRSWPVPAQSIGLLSSFSLLFYFYRIRISDPFRFIQAEIDNYCQISCRLPPVIPVCISYNTLRLFYHKERKVQAKIITFYTVSSRPSPARRIRRRNSTDCTSFPDSRASYTDLRRQKSDTRRKPAFVCTSCRRSPAAVPDCDN